MRKNIAAGVAGTRMIHDHLGMSRSMPGRKARWTVSTRHIQWMKRLSAKRVRRTLDAQIAETIDCGKPAVPQAISTHGIPVVVKGKGQRMVERKERAFTSPSAWSLFRYEKTVRMEDFLEEKAFRRMRFIEAERKLAA